MNFAEALKIANSNENIIGTTTDSGVEIDTILIVPVDEKERDHFFGTLMLTRNPQQAIAPFMNSDVEVLATDSRILYEKGVFCFKTLGS